MSAHKLTPSRKGPWHLLIGPYDADLVAAIKAKIPARGRQWDAVLRAWRIGNEYVEVVERELDNLDASIDAEQQYDADLWGGYE